MPSIRADNLGSLLRPEYLLEARSRTLPAEELRTLEDRAILEAIALQEDVGMPIVTDGEFRRRMFFSTIETTVSGLDPEGFVRSHRDGAGNAEEVRCPTPVARLERQAFLAEIELDFLRAHTERPVKVAMPSPSLLDVYWKPGGTSAYPTREAYLEHLIELTHEDAVQLAAHGASHIQLDAPHYAYIQSVLPDVADRDETLRRLVEYDNRVLLGVEGVTTCLHICRGNYKSRFTGTEPYDAFAASILPYAEFDRLLLEYDDERSGGFAPLRHVRDDATVVLGLVTTKRSAMESADELEARIEEASRYVPLERLALSTQCGFGSTSEGNVITREAQRAKLELVVEVATKVWGHP